MTECAAPPFASVAEFRAALDAIFALMSEHPDMGPRRRDADIPNASSSPISTSS